MEFRPDIDEVMGRTKTFYETNDINALILVDHINSIKYAGADNKKLCDWNFPRELHAFLDSYLMWFEDYWTQRINIFDDLIPSVNPIFGYAEHSAFLGGEVTISDGTSWHHRLLNNWCDIDNLTLKEDNVWLRMLLDAFSYLKERSEGKYALKLRGANAPQDLANTLRGNDFFTDFFDYPDEIKNLLSFCVDAIQWTLSHQHSIVGTFDGGVITGGNVWLPGNSTGHLSEDASTMCSPQIYEEFGLPYTSKLVQNYDHVYMHTHGLGRHVLPLIASIPNVDVIDIANDPKCIRSIEIYKEYADCLKDKYVVVALNYDEMKENISFLKGRKTIIRYSAEDLDDANRAIRFVRSGLN